MLRNQSLSTQIGFLLVLLLTGVALVPSLLWGWLVAKAIAVLILLGYVWWVNTRDHTTKRLTLRIEGIGDEEAKQYEQRLKGIFGETMTVLPSGRGHNALMVRIESETTLAAMTRRLKKAGLGMSLMGVEGKLTYTAMSGQARMRVEVEGIASPHSKVFIAGLDSPATADADGRFKVAVPFALVKQHQSKGYIPAEWRKDQVAKKIRVQIPG